MYTLLLSCMAIPDNPWFWYSITTCCLGIQQRRRCPIENSFWYYWHVICESVNTVFLLDSSSFTPSLDFVGYIYDQDISLFLHISLKEIREEKSQDLGDMWMAICSGVTPRVGAPGQNVSLSLTHILAFLRELLGPFKHSGPLASGQPGLMGVTPLAIWMHSAPI